MDYFHVSCDRDLVWKQNYMTPLSRLTGSDKMALLNYFEYSDETFHREKKKNNDQSTEILRPCHDTFSTYEQNYMIGENLKFIVFWGIRNTKHLAINAT